MTKFHALRLIPACAAALLLAACATTATNNTATSAEASQAALKQRVQARWDDLIARHAEKAYDYLTPGYQKTVSRKTYASQMNNRPVKWTKADVTSVKCASADNCEVYVMVYYTARMSVGAGGGVSSFAPLKETWLQLRNQWYYLPREEGKSTLHAAH